MATNVFQVGALNTNLLIIEYSNPPLANQQGSEIPMVPDNLNRHLANCTVPMGLWETHTTGMGNGHSSEANRNAGSWWLPNGVLLSQAARPQGAFFSRVVTFTDEVSRFGYVGSVVGGVYSFTYSIDAANGGAIDYEPPYGHGVISWPVDNTNQNARFRNASSLPSDGASRINTTGSAWNRSNRLHPVYYTAHIIQGGTIASGSIQVLMEQRPTNQLTRGGNDFPASAGSFPIEAQFPGITTAQYHLLLARLWGSRARLTYNGVSVYSTDTALNAAYPPLRAVEPRTRAAAMFQLNPEYYGAIVDSWLAIYTNKTSFFPVYLTDLSTAWPSSAHPRPAGFAFDSATLNMWALSEGGELALIDMSVEGGVVTLKTPNTTALATGERFGAVAKIGTVLYALIGTYSDSMAHTPATETVGIVSYDITANTWGTRHDYTGMARHNVRSLRELVALENGKLAMLVESIGASVLVPPILTAYATDTLPNAYGVPANLQSMVVKLDARDRFVPGVNRFKLRYQLLQAHAISATIKRVPAGSAPGTAWTTAAVITHGAASAWDNDSTTTPRTTDWINLDLDPDYDYYVVFYAGIPNAVGACFDGTNGPRYEIYSTPEGTTIGNTRTGFFEGNLLAAATVPDLEAVSQWHSGILHAAVVDIINDSGTDVFVGNVNKGLSTTSVGWQLLTYDPAGSVWNATTLDANGALNCPASSSRVMAELFNPSAGKLLIQASAGKDRIFVFDYSGTLDNSKFTDLSWGAGGSIFPTDWDTNLSTQDLTIQRNSIDSSLVFYLNGRIMASLDSGEYAHSLGWAHPTFAWDGTEKFQQFSAGNYSGGSTNAIYKDGLYPSRVGSGNANAHLKMIPSFSDTQVTFLHPGANASDISPTDLTGGTYYLPRYFKNVAGAWTIAKNWADAEANPMTIPATYDTPVAGPDGLVMLFGPNANTTFLTGEFHSFNVAYGYVKFARRGRYTFTVFAGRTFQMTETKTLADLRAAEPVVHHPPVYQLPPSISGPGSISGSAGHSWWPTYNTVGDYLNDAPAVVTYDFTVAKPGNSLVPAMSANTDHGMTASASQVTSGDAWAAFSREAVTPSNEFSGWIGHSVTPWLKINTGATPVALSYSLQVVHGAHSGSDIEDMSNWKIQGSVDGNVWDDLHIVTGHNWGSARPWDSKGYSLPYLGNLTASGAYRDYRVIFHLLSGDSYVGIASFELYTQALASSVNFSDIVAFNDDTGPAYGLTFEVDLGAGFVAITPRFRSHQGEIYSFDRQEGVQKLRITTKNGRYLNNTTRYWGPVALWDYGTMAVVNAARLGSAVATENTPAKGSFDSQCIGVAADAVSVTVDDISPQQFVPVQTSNLAQAYRGWHLYGPWRVQGANQFVVHPFFGFVRLAPNVTGTNVKLSYAWGRRV